MENEETNYRLTSYCPIGQTEEIIKEVNSLVVLYKEELLSLKRENRIYRESITSISHDIRTPLTTCKGYLQMLQRGELSETKRIDYMKIIEQRLDSLTNMLNQLFEYARIEAGEMQFEPQIFNAGNIFAETISMFYEDFVKRDCEPQVTITEKPCMIKTDKQAYIRIIENLIKNSLVHGKGGYQISFTKENEQCLITVSNLTDSIEVQDINKVFDRFYTTDQSRTKKTTGLGLAIVKRFVVQMGGDVNAYLEGNRFTIKVALPILSTIVL